MTEQLTKEQAIEFHQLKAYEGLTHRQIAEFQIQQQFLCIPFNKFHEAVEKTLARPVYTHEFGLNVDRLKAELFDDAEPPTIEEIMELIPEEKRLIILHE